MSILVVGSIALDTLETPSGKWEDCLGGSATYFSYAASLFDHVELIGVVGEDFPQEHLVLLKERGIGTAGLEIVPGGKTFRWSGVYHEDDLGSPETLATHLNVFESFKPVIPDDLTSTPYLFLANIDPTLQLQVLNSMKRPKCVICDTMNLWINIKKDELLKLLSHVDILIVNDAEARQLTETSNTIAAGRQILGYGPSHVVVKKGEHGAMLLGKENEIFLLPAFPVTEVHDPTGAGDSFAGGFVGHLAKAGNMGKATLRRALSYGIIVSSFTVEAFSLNRLKEISWQDIEARYTRYLEAIRL